MSIRNRIYQFLVMSNYKNFNIVPDVEAWRRYLDSLPAPKDNIDRAHNKYLCKKYYYSKKKLMIVRTISYFGLLLGRLFMMMPDILFPDHPMEGRLVLFESDELPSRDVFPEALSEQYGEIIHDSPCKKTFGRMNSIAKEIFSACVKRFPDDPLFLFMAYKELAKHSYILNRYSPQAVAQFVIERNIASPLITELYQRRDLKYISFMHGDYLLQMIQAYMQFSEYYAWDQAYVDMFVNELHCDPAQFRLYTPGKLTKKWNLENVEPEFDCTYYFSSCSEKSIDILADVFKKMKANGMRCKVRLHPRWQINDHLIRSKFSGFFIEEPGKISMEQSLGSTRYAIGLSSTVLHEALVEGRKVVIDDLSSPNDFKSLYERHYILLKKEHILLSNFSLTCIGDVQ